MKSVLPRREDGIETICSMVLEKFGTPDPSRTVKHLLGSAEELQKEVERWKKNPTPDTALRILDGLNSMTNVLSGLRYSSGLPAGREVDRMLAFRLAIEQYHRWRANITKALATAEMEDWNF